MFKNLREKITTTDPTKSKKKSSNNGELTSNDNSNEASKNSGGNQSLSRFSSLSSLVSDVGSAFTKSMTAPQHIQPSNNTKLYDNESISEFDDSSLYGGDTCSKEELFQRYQRAQTLARRFKTRFLEAAENCKRIETDNNKLSHALSDCQDKQIRRINELKEQIELDKKAKQDVEENYVLMIEEKIEMVNVLKLQVSLLKEGKDLPPELEEQIKKKHEVEVLLEKQKQDEIKDLKNTLSQREHLLQRCKDKINSLNSQLNEFKLKFQTMQNTSIFNDDDKIFNDFSLQRAQHISNSENIDKVNTEPLKTVLRDLENKKFQFEQEIKSQFDLKCAEMKLEEQQLKEKIRSLTLENENLFEQFNIKTKIIQDLMNDQFTQYQDFCDPSVLNTPVEKLKLCKLIISKHSSCVHPVIDELQSVLASVKIMPKVEDMSSCYVGNSEEFTENVVASDSHENETLTDLTEQNKFLNSKIEQMVKLKSICEEENINREKELLEMVSILEEEKKDFIAKNKKFEDDFENFKNDIKELCYKNEEILHKLSETQSSLNKTELEKLSIIEEKNILFKSFESLEQSVKNLETENEKLLIELEKIRNENSEIDSNLSAKFIELETYGKTFTEKQEECKHLKDKLDECFTTINYLNNEKNELLSKLNERQFDDSNKDEKSSLIVIEMQQRFDQESKELKKKQSESEKINEEQSVQIKQLNIQLNELKEFTDLSKQELEQLKTQYRSLIEENETKEIIIKNLEIDIEQLNKEIESLKFQLGEMIAKFDTFLEEKEELMTEIQQLNSANKDLQSEIDFSKNHTNKLVEEIENLTLTVNEKSELIEKKINENVLLNENLLSTVGLLESVQLQLEDLTSKQNSLMKENQSIVESLQQSSDENEPLKLRAFELEINVDNILKEKEEIIHTLNDVQEKVDILTTKNQELLNELKRIEDIKEILVLELTEKSDLLVKENQEKILQNDKHIELAEENEIKLKEIEWLKCQLLEKEELASKNEKLNKEIKTETSIEKDQLNNLKEELFNLNCVKSDLEEKFSRTQSENLNVTKSLNDEKFLLEKLVEEKSKIITELEDGLQNSTTTIICKEESIANLQKTINDKNETISMEIQAKTDLSSKINLIESYLCKFCSWIEELTNIENCHGECNQSIYDNSSSAIHWNSDMESECSDSKILIIVGQSIEKLLSINHRFHREFHENSKRSIETLKTQSELQKKLDSIIKEIDTILKKSCENYDFLNNNVSSKLEFINSTMTSLIDQLLVKSNLLSEIESQVFQLNDSLDIDNLSTFDNIPISFCLNGLEKKIIDIVNYYKQVLLINEENHTKARTEYEKVTDEKSERLSILMVQMFKQLISIFHLTDVHVNNISDINKQTRKNVIKKLKDIEKNHEQTKTELEDLHIKLTSKEKDLKTSVELNLTIQSELDDLKNSVANDRDRLMATNEELENSMRRLNEVADEKGRIDEEKQSLRKELKELNEKITNLKVEFEKQSSEKVRLEMQFDESLEKVKLNHAALEEMYKKELETQHGYQKNLEEQMACHKESTDLKLTESEKKLEEVLNQSEQLLELNYKYKTLLDETKLETSEIESKYYALQQQNSEIVSESNRLNSENTELKDTINISQAEFKVQSENLKSNISILADENRKLSENIQKITREKNEEIEIIKTELDHVRVINETLRNKIDLLESKSEQMILKEKSILNQSSEMVSAKTEFENQIAHLQSKLDETEIKCLTLISEKNQLMIQLNSQIKSCDQLKIQIGDLKNVSYSYKNQIDNFSLEIEQMKTRHDIEKEELEQQFADEKLNMDDDVNRRLKKLTKEFSDKIFEKERDFQKTFEEALSNIRKDESRMKSDLRSTIDELNKSTIELQTERNQLLDQLSQNDKDIKTFKKLIDAKSLEFESIKNELAQSITRINELENEKQSTVIAKISKMNQTVESSTCYEEPFLDTVTVRDHEVLLMHCSDIEEQLKQLQSENINLKNLMVTHNSDLSSPAILEPLVYSSKSKPLSSQPSLSNDIVKHSIQHHSSIYRSPNTSCSDYTFCPIPITEATDYEYLHDVLLKYMTGMETEILAKVVCTVMKFSSEETSRVLCFEQDRNKFIRRIL